MTITNATVGAMQTIAYKNNKGSMLKVVIRFGDGETIEATMFDDLARSCTLQPGDIIDLDGHWNKKERFNNFDVLQYWHSTGTENVPAAGHSGHPIEIDPKLAYKFTESDLKTMTSTETPTNGPCSPAISGISSPAISGISSPLITINERLIAEVDNTPLNPYKEPLKGGNDTSLNPYKEPLKGGIGSLEYKNESDECLTSNSDSGQTSHSEAVSDALIQQYKNNSKIKFF